MAQMTVLEDFGGRLAISDNVDGLACVGVVSKEFFVVDPYMSECGRFEVEPSEYGLTQDQARFIKGFNDALEIATDDAINGGALEMQKFLGVTAGDFAGRYFSGISERNNIRHALAAYGLAEYEDHALNVKSQQQQLEVVYLANATGDCTGYGTLQVTDEDLDKVPFERGPGCVLSYLAEIAGRKYVMGNLEVAFKDDFWGEDGNDFDPESEVREYCEGVLAFINPRVVQGELCLPLDAGDPGRLIVQVAVPIESIADRTKALERISAIFGTAANHASLAALADHPADGEAPETGTHAAIQQSVGAGNLLAATESRFDQGGQSAKAALSDILGVLLRADQEGRVREALFAEGITDAYDSALDAGLRIFGNDGLADIAYRYELDQSKLVNRMRAD